MDCNHGAARWATEGAYFLGGNAIERLFMLTLYPPWGLSSEPSMDVVWTSMDVVWTLWTSGHSGGRQGRPRGRQVEPDGSPGPPKRVFQVIDPNLVGPLSSFAVCGLRVQCSASADGRLPIPHPVEHDVSLSDAAEHLALYSLWYGLGGM